MNDDATPPAPERTEPGLLIGITQLLGTIVEMIYTRLELVFMELEDGVGGVLSLLLWSCVALFAASAGLFIGALALIFVFWDTHRVLVSVLVTCTFLGIALTAALVLRAKVRARRGFFATTLDEFGKDRDFFRSGP